MIRIKDRDQGSGSRIGIKDRDQGSGSRTGIKDQDQGSGSRIKDLIKGAVLPPSLMVFFSIFSFPTQAKDTVRMSNASTIHVVDEEVTGWRKNFFGP